MMENNQLSNAVVPADIKRSGSSEPFITNLVESRASTLQLQ